MTDNRPDRSNVPQLAPPHMQAHRALRPVNGDHSRAELEERFGEHLEEAERWRFHNHEGSPPPNFDFWFGPAEEARLAAVCESLRSNPNSLFVQNLMCMRADAKGGMKRLVGRVLALPGEEQVILPNAPAFVSTLERHFGLSDPDFAGLWPKLCARHEEVFGDKPAAEIQLGGPPDPS